MSGEVTKTSISLDNRPLVSCEGQWGSGIGDYYNRDYGKVAIYTVEGAYVGNNPYTAVR